MFVAFPIVLISSIFNIEKCSRVKRTFPNICFLQRFSPNFLDLIITPEIIQTSTNLPTSILCPTILPPTILSSNISPPAAHIQIFQPLTIPLPTISTPTFSPPKFPYSTISPPIFLQTF